jgi:hypothetical protein
MILRIRYEKLGGHYHCRLFTARGPNQTFAKCGDLAFDENEWPAVEWVFRRGGAEVIPEGKQAKLENME